MTFLDKREPGFQYVPRQMSIATELQFSSVHPVLGRYQSSGGGGGGGRRGEREPMSQSHDKGVRLF